MCKHDIGPEKTKNAFLFFLEGACRDWFEGTQKLGEKE